MPKRIAVLVTHDFEDSEYTEPVEAFRAAGNHYVSVAILDDACRIAQAVRAGGAGGYDAV